MAKKRSKPSRPAKRAKKPTPPPPPAAVRGGTVTAERAARLYKLLQLLGTGPQSREALIRHLGLDVRGFYRDLEVLRGAGISVELQNRQYVLKEAAAKAVVKLPFPDPHVTLGEAQQLAKGRTAAHRKLKQQLDQIMQ
jgi:predicted DNA-binding transcriptional regulator YafY